MLDRVAEFIQHHAMFETGERVGVAVSGGPDSVFLLHALHQIAPRWNLKLSVVHIEHGIRGEASRADAGFVRDLAASFALPFHLHSADVPALGGNLEQTARAIRHAFYAKLTSAGTLQRIATGHTHNDQAETVLYRILRGSGLSGLAGILPRTEEGLVRPLLEIERHEIEAWLGKRAIGWRQDETNLDPTYARNRLRHEILPLLRANFNPRLDDALCHLAALAQDEEQHWEQELGKEELAACRLPPGEWPVLDASALAGMSRAKARRLIRHTIERAKGNLRQIDFAHVERIVEMAQSGGGHDRVQLPGVDVLRSFNWLRFTGAAYENGSEPASALPLQPPGSAELPGSRTRITLRLLKKAEVPDACDTVVGDLDWQRVTLSNNEAYGLELRAWRPGDQYRPAGQPKQQKLKDLFQEARVPLWERSSWPIITYNGVILWARRFGAAAEFAVDLDTRIILRVDESVSDLSNRQDGS